MEIKQEFKKSGGVLRTPCRKRPRAKGIRRRIAVYDSFTLTAVRGIVHSFFRRNEIPTVRKIAAAINEDLDLPRLSDRTVYRVLKDIGFEKQRRRRQSLLIERNDIVAWRQRYLRCIRNYRREGRPVFYVDETWVTAGETKKRVWTDTNVTSAKDAFMQGVTVGLTAPSGKGQRLIITHAGSQNGFVDGTLDVFCGKKQGDYHEEMDSNRFEAWFQRLLVNIPRGSVVVMDNAPYHSRRVDSVPTQKNRKAEIQAWLTMKAITWDEEMLKPELLQIVNSVRHLHLRYKVDAMAEDAGCVVLRLPPYHCELNPIELIWAQIKNEVASKNTTFKLADVKVLLEQAMNNVTPDNWSNVVRHVLKLEDKFREADMIMENIPELVIHLGSDESSSSDADLSGVEPLGDS